MVTSHEHGVIGENFDEAGLRQGIEGILNDVDDTVVRLDVGGDDLLSVGGHDTGVKVASAHNRNIGTKLLFELSFPVLMLRLLLDQGQEIPEVNIHPNRFPAGRLQTQVVRHGR